MPHNSTRPGRFPRWRHPTFSSTLQSCGRHGRRYTSHSLTSVPLSKEKPDLNKKVHEVPHKPGVYLMRDRFGRVIYVGKARDLRKRVGSYFMPSKMAVADLKTRALLEAVWDFETHTVAERSGIAAARRQADQGISAALQHLVSRRQTLSRRESRSDRGMAAFSPGALQEGRRRALLRTVCACRSTAADAQFHAQKIRRADFRPGGADGARIEIVHLSSADAPERNRRRNLSPSVSRKRRIF